jgi:hypothetical protein
VGAPRHGETEKLEADSHTGAIDVSQSAVDGNEGNNHSRHNALNGAAKIRQRVIHGLARELGSLRVFIASTTENYDLVNRMRGDPGTALLARVADFVMSELGDSAAAQESGVRRSTSRGAKASGI